MPSYRLSETSGAGMAPHYVANGKRVTKERFESIKQRAFACGRLDCFSTKARQVGTTFRRTNYSHASWEGPQC